MLALLSPKLWIAVALAVVLTLSHGVAYRAGRANVRAAWDKEKSMQDKAALSNIRKTEIISQNLQGNSDASQKNSATKIAKLNAAVAVAIDGLRNRPERPTNMPTVAGTNPAGCSANQLYREDATIALGIASDAVKVSIALDQCVDQYNKAKQAVNAANLTKPD